MPETNQDEKALVSRAIDGDEEAFGKLYLLHLDAIYRYVYYRIGSMEDAEDLTEQIFLKAWEALPGYQQRGKPFTSWLYRIAHNIIVDFHRKRKNNEISVDKVYDESLDDGQPGILQKIVEQEEAKLLANAISQLSDEQQQVIVLRFVEGLSHKEVARILGKNEGACRMIQYRALSVLQQILQKLTD
jgi:RNA polymerase sigma-70 factor (ECF subfamily)